MRHIADSGIAFGLQGLQRAARTLLDCCHMLLSRRAALRLLSTLPPLLGLGACSRDESDPITSSMRRVETLFRRKTPPRPGDWLATHRETGQSFDQYRAFPRDRVASLYSTLRIVPIGPLSPGQSEVLHAVADLMGPFFGLALSVDAQVSLAEIPADAQRIPYEGAGRQLLTTHLLQQVLPRYRKASDAAVLGISASDLWAGPGWNFVFGQGSLTERVGVWSMARNGDADADPQTRHACLVRTLKTATHETGHMLGIKHCIAYECGMNGSNYADERDRQPVEYCPECQAKLWWACNLDPAARSESLSDIARRHELTELAAWWKQQARLLTASNEQALDGGSPAAR
jgi:archaemetzincin